MSRHPPVEYVEEDGVYTVNGVQTLSPNSSTFRGIDRIDQRDLPLDNIYASNRVGNGVHAYVLDTGTWITHPEFQGRANVSYDAFGGEGIDRLREELPDLLYAISEGWRSPWKMPNRLIHSE